MVPKVVEQNAENMKLLSKPLLAYHCSQYDQSARSRYFSVKRQESNHVCDFLLRLNVYARAAQIQCEKGGAESKNHVEHLLLNCGDDDLMGFIYRNDWVIYIE